MSEWRQKDKSTMYEQLRTLEQQGYVHKAYEPQWRLLGKPAVYSLTAAGIRIVRDTVDDYIAVSVLRNQYKNRSASSQLVDHSLAIAKLCLELRRQYGDDLELFTKAEIAKYDAFLRPLPDLYLRGSKQTDGTTRHFQLEMIEAGTMTWMIKKRINAHSEWHDENNEKGWMFEDNYPTLLLVCGNTSTEKRVHRLVDGSVFDFDILTTTNERLLSGDTSVWLEFWDDDELEFVALPLK